jgi:N-acetylglucosaminyl-diphospho-decaprenol L-rhamnosyltransferase
MSTEEISSTPAVALVGVCAVVVNHDAGDALLTCVASLRDAGVSEIVVVDNSSSDGSFARLAEVDKEVVLVPSGANLGYGHGVNLGVKRTTGEVLLICNPDLTLERGAAEAMVAALKEAPDVAVVGPLILGDNGTRYPSARRFPSLVDAVGHAVLGLLRPDNQVTRRYQLADSSLATEKDVDWVSGACMAIRRLAFSSVGGFDPGYFMYVEDLDLCWRLRRAGWRVLYLPAASVTHVGGVSSRRHPYRMLAAHHRSTLRFFSRSSAGGERALVPVVALGLFARLLLAWALEAKKMLHGAHIRRARAVE